MRALLLLIAIVFLVSCNSDPNLGTPSGSDDVPNNSQGATAVSTDRVDYDAPANPLDVTVVLNDRETASAVITPQGGRLTLTSADGSVYTLEVPAGALDVDTELRMTVIDSLEGAPVQSKVYGVQLEPSGLAFSGLLTLTIQPAADIPLEEQFMFKYEGSGTDFRRSLIDPDSRDIRIFLTGFSGGGSGRVTLADLAQWRMDRARSAASRIENAIGEQQALERAGKITQQQAEAAIDNLLSEFQEAVQNAEKAATEDCKNLAKAIELRQTFQRLEVFGSGENLAPIAKYQKELDKCRTYRANGGWGNSSLEGVIKIQSPFSLNISTVCNGKMDFLGNRLSGPVKCDLTCAGIRFTGSGKFNIKLTDDGGFIQGSCSTLAVGVPNDIEENEPFYVTLVRITQ